MTSVGMMMMMMTTMTMTLASKAINPCPARLLLRPCTSLSIVQQHSKRYRHRHRQQQQQQHQHQRQQGGREETLILPQPQPHSTRKCKGWTPRKTGCCYVWRTSSFYHSLLSLLPSSSLC